MDAVSEIEDVSVVFCMVPEQTLWVLLWNLNELFIAAASTMLPPACKLLHMLALLV